MYYRDNKLCSKRDIPRVVLDNMVEREPYEYIVEAPQEIAKVCLFCGTYGKFQRLVNNKVVVLCEEHYYGKNVGTIAAEIRRQADAER